MNDGLLEQHLFLQILMIGTSGLHLTSMIVLAMETIRSLLECRNLLHGQFITGQSILKELREKS